MGRKDVFDVPGRCFGILLLYLITNATRVIYGRAMTAHICAMSDSSFLQHESNCSKYYVCSNGRALIMECPSGLYFDVKYNVCNWNNLVECSSIPEEARTTTTTVTTEEYTTPTPTPTSSPATRTTTSEATSPTTQSTPQETSEADRTTTYGLSEELTCQNGEDSTCHRHPTDCRKFYNCENGQAIINSCEEGTYFNDEGCYCDNISQTYC